MTNVWCVRADYGKYTEKFLDGGFVAIGFGLVDQDLSHIRSRDELYPIYVEKSQKDTSKIAVGQQVGQMARLLFEIKPGDYVITPAADSEWLHYGQVAPDSSYYFSLENDGCPFPHRLRVEWSQKKLARMSFSVPFQNTIRSMLTVFSIKQKDEFLITIGRKDLASPPAIAYDSYQVVLERILELDDKEFELLAAYLLTALGFEGSEVTGKVGDGGVDAIGELNISSLAKVKIFVQAKRYKLGSKITANTVKKLRSAIPLGGQGAFITTADFQSKAGEVAIETGFPRIGLVNGRQLVDLLVEHWNDIPDEFKERLGLKSGLVIG